MTIELLIGNKNHSSWSLRPWLALEHAAIPYREKVIELYREGSRKTILSWSPMGKVPVIRDGKVVVWDSLSILEYLAETFPEAALWPEGKAARAHARSVSAEMHSSFRALRIEMPMDIRAMKPDLPMSDEALADAARVDEIWSDCRTRYDTVGPFLFGGFSIADAMYAPVVFRFRSYGYTPSPLAQSYMALMLNLPAMKKWEEAALKEPWVNENLERKS
jgi:glutathione S-transferase